MAAPGQETTPGTEQALSRREARRVWRGSFLILFALGSLWSLASPLFAVADEPAHVTRAAAVARGQVTGSESDDFPDHQVRSTVRIPAIYGTATTLPACYIGTGGHAGCAPRFEGPRDIQPTLTQVGRYPPLYYFVVGLPTLLFPSAAGVYLMRLVSLAMATALLASAFESARTSRPRGALTTGLFVALTPMAVFLAGSVNPSGVEVAAAIALWTSLVALLLTETPEDGGRVTARAGVAACVLALTRQFGPLWVVSIVSVVLVVAGRDRWMPLLGRRDVRRWGAATVSALTVAVAWLVARDTFSGIGGTPPLGPLSWPQVVLTSLGGTGFDVLQMIGVFGWTETRSPLLAYYLWFVCLGFLTVASVAAANRRQLAALVALVLAVVALPVLFESTRAREIGFVWLGRYILPLAVGVPLLAAVVAARPLAAVGPRAMRAMALFAGSGHLIAYVGTLRRYTGSLNPFPDAPWSPPGSAPILILAFAVATAAYVWWLHHLVKGLPGEVR